MCKVQSFRYYVSYYLFQPSNADFEFFVMLEEAEKVFAISVTLTVLIGNVYNEGK